MIPDLSTWLTKQQAADACGVSTKAIERWAKAGKLEAAFRPQAGTPDVVVYFPEDVARIAAARQRTAGTGFLVPDRAAVHRNGNGSHGDGQPTADSLSTFTPPIINPGEDLFRALVTAAVRVVSETSEARPAYVPLPEALRVSGLSRSAFRRAVAAGEVTVRGRRYRRQDVEAL